MVSVDQAYMVGHMKNADGSINNKNVVLSAISMGLSETD